MGVEETAVETTRYRPITDDAGRGEWQMDPDGRTVLGWAIDADDRAPADLVVVFSGDEVVDLELPTFRRQDVARQNGLAPSEPIGFEAFVGDADPTGITVVAIVGNRVLTLPMAGG